ncbi:MAG TPA: hypothetical protein VJX67_05160, partial [Blastocatellia bacterium]|nr:hypothetical protein [Blastocatellia bacterium]
MNRSLVKIAPLAGFILSLVLIGVRPALTGSLPPLRPLNRTPEVTPKPFANYRSPTQTHKAIVDKNDTAVLSGLIASGARLIEDYGSFALYGVPGTSLNPDSGSTNPLDEKSTRAIRDDLNLILLSTGTFDTTQVESSDGSGPDGPAASTLAPSTGTRSEPQLLLVQMIGPIKPEWLVWLRSRSDILSYVPNDAYLVRPKRGRSAELAQAGQVGPGFVQWTGPFKPQYKVAPRILSAEGGALASVEPGTIVVTVQIARSSHTSKTIAEVTALADSVASEPVRISNYVDLRIRANRESIQRIAEFTNVVWIEP